MHRWLALVLFIVAAFLAAALGGAATSSSVTTWYPTLAKPVGNPPSWVFGPVWTLLYLLMGIVAWRVWLRRSQAGTGVTLRLWWAQLCLNVLWSLLFFGLRQPGAALFDIVVMWAVLVAIQFRLSQQDRIASWLWAPYVAWVSFATWLNFGIWHLN